MKQFILGFFSCVCLFVLCGLSPKYTKHEMPDAMDSEFENIYLYAQPKTFNIKFSTPDVNDLNEREVALMKTGDLKLITRHNNKRYYVKLTEF